MITIRKTLPLIALLVGIVIVFTCKPPFPTMYIARAKLKVAAIRDDSQLSPQEKATKLADVILMGISSKDVGEILGKDHDTDGYGAGFFTFCYVEDGVSVDFDDTGKVTGVETKN